MKTVGDMLKGKRLEKGITLEEVEKATKIRKKFLEAIETDAYERIPSPAYAKGFVKNYSEFLSLDSSTILAFFRRQTRDVSRQSLLPHKIRVELSESWCHLTPGRFIALLLGILFLVFFSYFAIQLRKTQTAPTLTIQRPIEDYISEEIKIDVLGTTDTDATVTINGASVIVQPDGSFFDQVALVGGVNTITVTSTSRFGKSTTIIRKVGLKQ